MKCLASDGGGGIGNGGGVRDENGTGLKLCLAFWIKVRGSATVDGGDLCLRSEELCFGVALMLKSGDVVVDMLTIVLLSVDSNESGALWTLILLLLSSLTLIDGICRSLELFEVSLFEILSSSYESDVILLLLARMSRTLCTDFCLDFSRMRYVL